MGNLKRDREFDNLQKQFAALKRRVDQLEAALRRKRSKLKADKIKGSDDQELAQRDARTAALNEYYEKRREQQYRDYPSSLRMAWKCEQQENAFLLSKGLEPTPSIIPASLRAEARRLAEDNS